MDDDFEQRVKKLKETLMERGIASSDTAAQNMAEGIVSTEMRQQKKLDERRYDANLNPQQKGKQAEQAPATSADTPSPSEAAQTISSDSLDQQAATRIAGKYGIDTDKPISELLKEADEPQQAIAPKTVEPQQEPEPQGTVDEKPRSEDAVQEDQESDKNNPKVDLSEMFNFSKR